MNSQISPDQMQLLTTLSALILLAVTTRLIGMALWRNWLKDSPADSLTQEERDERLVQRRRLR